MTWPKGTSVDTQNSTTSLWIINTAKNYQKENENNWNIMFSFQKRTPVINGMKTVPIIIGNSY